MKIKLSLFLSVCCLMGATADDLVVDNYERVSVVATNGDVSVDSIFSAPKAVAAEKTGANALTLVANAVQTRDPVPVRVLEGTLNLVPSTDPGLAEPACLQRAALWMDASRGSTLVPPDGATGDEVARWYDVRETFANGQWSTNYYCAEARKSFVTNEVSPGVWEKVIRYPVKKTALTNGMDYVDFNGRASGSWMRLLGKGRGDLTALDYIHHVFFSGCVSNSWGFPLGANSTMFWHPASYNGVLGALGGVSTSQGVYAGTTRWNGKDVMVNSAVPGKGPYLHEWHAGHYLGTFSNFFNDRNIWNDSAGYRTGGDALGEVVVFTNRLSAAERMAVGEYLLRKWTGGGRSPGALEVSAATNTTVSVAVGAASVQAGAGRVNVAAGAEAVYSQKVPSPGTLRVDSGRARVFAGEVPFAFAAGDALTVKQTTYGVLTASNAPMASLAAANEAMLALSATTSVRVTSLPAEMKRLSAHGAGEVVLSAPRADFAPKAGGDIFATMPNADMEAWQSSNKEYSQTALGTYYNWTITSRPAGWLYFLNLANCKSGTGHWVLDGGTKSCFRYEDYPFQGKVVMAIKQGLVVENTVTFPQAGDYELTFLTAGRMLGTRGADNYAGGQVKMSLVRNGVTNAIGTAMGYVEHATRHQRFRVRGVEAGAYTFVLNHDVGTGDAHTIMDDFRFRLITEPETETVVRPPNGDFERANISYAARNTEFSTANTVEDWTFSSSGQTNPDVCVLTRGMTSGALYLDSASAWGGIQLALYGANATITSSAFTLPAGKWQLRCRMGGMFTNEGRKWNGKGTNRTRKLQAWLVADGAETSLGTTGDQTYPDMLAVTFGSPVTLDAPATVQLRVRQIGTETSSIAPCAVIDDLEFVRLDNVAGAVLAEAFETTTGWTFKAIKDGTSYTSKARVWVDNPARALTDVNPVHPYAYGLMCGVNKKALEFDQCGTATHAVTFPEPGAYRLEFSSRSRVWIYDTPSMNYAGNALAFFLVDGNDVTNTFYRTPSIYSTNFVFRSALFNVPAAGAYTFGIMSLNGLPLEDGTHLQVGKNATDVTALVDQVLIKKADETAEPDLPEKLALDLTDGTRLRLDYVGTNRIDRLRLNGQAVAGFIDASHPSGLVSGLGCLEVRPKGTMILFK